jgi:hypothetical protein
MKKLSTGHDSTLGNWLELVNTFCGPDSTAAAFIIDKIAASPNGADEEVVADERQFLGVLMSFK